MLLKVASLNLAGYKLDWQSRERKVVSFLNEVAPDIVLLQQVNFDASVSAFNQAASINRLLARPFDCSQTTISRFYQSSSGNLYREGLSVLSLFPIQSSEVLVLNKQPDDKHPRIVQNIDVKINSHKVGVSNVHFSNNAYSSEHLAEFLSILKSRGEQRIIAGDFNIFTIREFDALYKDTYLTSIDFKNYVSFPSEVNTLDYVLIPKNLAFNSLETYEGLSDHSALLFEIDITNL